MFAVRRFEPSADTATGTRPSKPRTPSSSSISTAQPHTTTHAANTPPTDSITVLSRKKADRLRLRVAVSTSHGQAQAQAEEEDERVLRREAKREKRRLRRQQTDVTADPVDGHKQPSAAADLSSLLSLKNSTRTPLPPPPHPLASYLPYPPPPPSTSSSTPIPPPPSTGPAKGQQKKDPLIRATERAARKRARQLKERRERGEVIDEEEVEEEATPPPPSLPPGDEDGAVASPSKRARTDPPPSPALSPSPSSSQPDAAVEEQQRLAARPHWMARPIHVDPSSPPLPTTSLALHPSLHASLQACGITQFTPIQATVLPLLLHLSTAHDVAISSPTGSGKTLIYILPILHSLSPPPTPPPFSPSSSSSPLLSSSHPPPHSSSSPPSPLPLPLLRALILLPSRALAHQVHSELTVHARPLHLRVGLATGGGSFRREQTTLVRRVGGGGGGGVGGGWGGDYPLLPHLLSYEVEGGGGGGCV